MFDKALRIARNLTLGLLLLPLLAAPAAAAADPDPDMTGIWTGKITAKTFSQNTGDKVTTRKYLVVARIARNGADVEIEADLIDSAGGESTYTLHGKAGNRNFWAFNGDTNYPILVVGKVSGKLPKLSITAKGTSVFDEGFQELKISLKRSKTAVLGTGATGAAVVGATITLKDRNGVSPPTVETDADGNFSLDVRGLTPPFLIKLDPLTGSDLYGVATSAGVANVTPFTDLILETWYGVQELDLATSFTNLDATTPMPTALDVALLEALVRRTIQKWLQDNGLDPETFNLLRTPFDADGTGIDGILDITTIPPDGSSITIDDGTTTQSSDVTASSVNGTVTVDTTTTSPGGTTNSTDGTALPGSTETQTAVASALTTMEAFRAKINSRGASLTASDIQGYLTTDFLDDGRDRTWFTAEIATDLRGSTMGPVTLKSIRYLDEGAGTLGLDLELHVSSQSGTGIEILPMDFKKSGTPWLLYGNRQIAELGVKVEYRTDYFPGSIDGPRKSVNVDVRGPKDSITAVKITGGTVFDNTNAPKDSHTEIMDLEPTPGTHVEYQRDAFFAGANFVDYPAPGTPFTLTVTPASGPDQVYTVYSNATTTETVTLSQPTGNSLATDATPGSPFTAQWTLPTTFAVKKFQFNGRAFSPDFECEIEAVPEPVFGDTTGTLTFPTTCGGQTIDQANFNLSFDGPNGERIMIIYEFNDF